MEFSPENILNIRDMKLAFDNRTMEGQSRIDSLKYPVSNLIAAYEARNAIFVKCGALGMFIDGNELIYRKREKSFNKSIQAIELSEEDCADLKTGIEKDFLFSGLKIGYKKKDYENTNGRFEFNGQHDYSSDYTGGSTKILELISPFRADCYGIEFLAQERGKDTKDDKSDKDLFMVNVWKEFGE
jgi:hypothetical protein